MTETEHLQILAIEDDADAFANLRDILALDGHRVQGAPDARAALARVDLGEFDLILLDWLLPDLRGEAVLPVLRERAPEAAVVVVTGHSDLNAAIAALRQGAADYLLKPVDSQALRAGLVRLQQRRAIDAAMRAAQARALQAERLAAIGEMVAGLAHESRNALQRSQACLEMLVLRVAGQPELEGLIGRIGAAQSDLHRLYEDVRAYAAPIHLERRRCRADLIWREAWNQVEDSAGAGAGRLRESIAPGPLECLADTFRLRQVFRNLFENSLAASRPPAQVAVDARQVRERGRWLLRIGVRDRGAGLPESVRGRVFEPFFTTRTRGTGLGLAIAKRIVDAHEGTLELGDEAPPGAEFVITLPRALP